MASNFSIVGRYLFRALLAACAICGVILIAAALIARANTRTHVVTCRLVPDQGEPTPEMLSDTVALMRERMNRLARSHGVGKWSVELTPERMIQIRLRTRFDPKGLLFWVTMPARIQFHLVHPEGDILSRISKDDLPKGYVLKVYHEVRYSASRGGDLIVKEHEYLVREEPAMRVSRLAGVEFSTAGLHKETVLTFRFAQAEGEEFRDMTALNLGRTLAMLVDGEIFFPPRQVDSALEGGVVQVRGYFYNPPLRSLVSMLEGGPFPARVSRLEVASHEIEK